MTIEEIYDESIKPLAPSERFRLATLILSEIPPQSVVDIRDAWNEEDMRDIVAYSVRLFTAEFPEESDPLLVNLVGPTGLNQAGLGDAHDEIADWSGVKDARVYDCRGSGNH